ncbi:hypothetical protein D9M73_144930 [compost metagenome]
MHYEAFGRVALQGFDQYGFLGAANVQGDHVAEGSLVFQQFGDFAQFQSYGLRLFVATVNYSRNQTGVTTQAAARTFPQVGTHFSIQSKIVHVVSPK